MSHLPTFETFSIKLRDWKIPSRLTAEFTKKKNDMDISIKKQQIDPCIQVLVCDGFKSTIIIGISMYCIRTIYDMYVH